MILPTHSVLAWGDEGHKIIGAIAYARLTPAAKRKIDALLAADKDNLTARDFVSRTAWADKYRDSDRSTTRVRYNATRHWHFVNIEIASGKIDSVCKRHAKLPPGTTASDGPPKACIIDKIEQFVAELSGAAIATPEKILALKFLLHLVGDLHQPLHVADNKDRGGNHVPVRFADDLTPNNLHSYWDNHLVQRLGNDPRAVGASLNNQITRAKADAWSKGTVSDWAKDSFRQVKATVYNFHGSRRIFDHRGVEGVRLNSAYDDRAMPVLRDQLSKAGVRLARVLNNALSE